jgi:hypothetical protein
MRFARKLEWKEALQNNAVPSKKVFSREPENSVRKCGLYLDDIVR